MPIYAIIREEASFSPEESTALISAYEITLAKLGLLHSETPLTVLIAKQIVAIASNGERDPRTLSASTIAALRLKPDRKAGGRINRRQTAS